MNMRLDPQKAAPQAIAAMLKLEAYLKRVELEDDLIHLVQIRASQINGCAFCLNMHTIEAQESGMPGEKLALLPVWQESSLFSPRERAALAWTEALTLLAETHAPDEEFDTLSEQFSEKEIVDLTLLIGAINVWNRLNVGFRTPPELAPQVIEALAVAG